MRQLLLPSLMFTLLAALLLNQPTGRHAQTRPPKSRALLIGIDRYQNAPAVKPTRGAEADATETKNFIKEKYGFDENDIHTLLGEKATAAGIKQEFKTWLIQGTQPGDRVFFLYAGHGSQTKDLNGDEADGLDEVLAPYDVNWRNREFINIISDDEIGGWVESLAGRQVVMVFDSCSSGTISRGGISLPSSSAQNGDARYLPSESQLAELPKTRGGETSDYIVQDKAESSRILQTVTKPSGRTTSDKAQNSQSDQRDLHQVDVKKLAPNTSVVVITAAQATQIAYSMWTPNPNRRQRGALSYVFAESQRTQQLSIRKLRQELKTRIKALQKQGLPGTQIPEIEVLSTASIEDLPLFAAVAVANSTPTPKPPASTVMPGNPQSNIRLSLQTREGKTIYRIGETASYQFTTNTAGYLYLIVFSKKDVATCIFPNENQKTNHFVSGTHTITRDGSEGFGVTEPIGKDVVVALLSTTPVNLGGDREDYTWNEVFTILKDARFGEYIRSRGQTAQKSAQLTNWQAVSLVLETIEKQN